MSEELERELQALRESAGNLGIKRPDMRSPEKIALDTKLERHQQVAHVSGPQAPTMGQAKRTWNGQ